MLNTATKVITTLGRNKIIPSHAIQKVRQLGLCNITSWADKVIYVYPSIKKNQYEPEGRLTLIRVQISRKITNIGMEIKKLYFDDTIYASIFGMNQLQQE